MDIEELLLIEKRIDERPADDIRDRWESGKLLLKERVKTAGAGRPGIPKERMAELTDSLGKSERELKYRMQFADKYPTEEEFGNALPKFTSWRQVIDSLSAARKKPAPKAKTSPSWDPDLVSSIAADIEHGADVSQSTLEDKYGISERVALNARTRAEGVVQGRDEGTVIDWATLDEPAKVKEARMRKQIRRELEAELEPTIQAEVQARIGASFKNAQQMHTEAKLVLEARKGVMTKADFQLILACLHPDNSASTEKRARAFDLFRRSEIVLLDERNSPAVTSLPSMEELLKRRASKK